MYLVFGKIFTIFLYCFNRSWISAKLKSTFIQMHDNVSNVIQMILNLHLFI